MLPYLIEVHWRLIASKNIEHSFLYDARRYAVCVDAEGVRGRAERLGHLPCFFIFCCPIAPFLDRVIGRYLCDGECLMLKIFPS